MQNLTDEKKAAIGKSIAAILMLRSDKEHKDRFQTAWGSKTALGIFNVVIRMTEDIQANNLTGYPNR